MKFVHATVAVFVLSKITIQIWLWLLAREAICVLEDGIQFRFHGICVALRKKPYAEDTA